MSDTLRLSAAGRNALRRAITDHDGWTSAFRNKHSLSLATMSRDDYFRAASLLDIDVAAVTRDADAAKNDAARDTFAGTAPKARSTDEVVRAATEAGRAIARRNASDITNAGTEASRTEFPADATPDEIAATISQRAKNEAARVSMSEGKGSTMSDTSGTASKLAILLAELAANSVDEARVREIVDGAVAAALADHAGPVLRIELTENSLPVGKVDGHQHPEFSKMLRCATARGADGFVPNVWIAGPAGSGKTFAVSQIARALDTAFHYNGAIGMSHELLGFVDAGGAYHRTAFRDAYEHGGCYLFDEVDGSDNAALLALNAALANGTATFPDGPIKRHKDCRIFAAANTWGMGATAEYVGRSKLDAAFLSRFPVRISWGYDETLEQAICGKPEFARAVQAARRAARTLGLKVLISPRDSMAGSALMAAGFSMTEAAEMTFLANLTPDQRTAIEREIKAERS